MKKNQLGKISLVNLILGLLVVLLVVIVVFQMKDNIDLKLSLSDNETEENTEAVLSLPLNLSWQQGIVKIKKGLSTSLKVEENDFSPMESGSLLQSGDEIRTGENGRAILEFENGGVIRLSENTEISLTKLTKEEIILTQDKGSSYNRVVLSEGGVYKIYSLDQTITALGTAFNVSCDKNLGQVNIDVIESEIKVELKKEDKVEEEKTVEAGKTVTVDAEKASAEVSDIDVENLKTEWYKWNKEEDLKGKYELGVLEKVEMDEVKDEFEDGQEEGTEEETAEEEDEALTLWGTAQDDGVHLSWTSYDGDNFSYYKVVRSETNSDLKYPADGYIKVSSDKSFSSYIDSAGKKDNSYYYRICAKIDGQIECGNVIQRTAINESSEEQEDKKEEEKSAFTPITDSLQLTAEAQSDGVHLSWSVYKGDDFSYGKVVRSKTNSDFYYPNDGYIKVLGSKATSAYTDTSAKNDASYYYRICTKTNSGEIKCGNVVQIKAETESEKEEKQTSGFVPVTDSLQLTAVKEGNSVNLSWTSSISDGFKYYKVVRSTTNSNLYYPNDGYIKYSVDKSFTSYTDSNLEAEETYYYRICNKEDSGEVWCGNVATIEN